MNRSAAGLISQHPADQARQQGHGKCQDEAGEDGTDGQAEMILRGIGDAIAGAEKVLAQSAASAQGQAQDQHAQGYGQWPFLCLGSQRPAHPPPAHGFAQCHQFRQQLAKPGAPDGWIAGNPQQVFIQQAGVIGADLGKLFLVQVQLPQPVDQGEIAAAQALQQILLAVQKQFHFGEQIVRFPRSERCFGVIGEQQRARALYGIVQFTAFFLDLELPEAGLGDLFAAHARLLPIDLQVRQALALFVQDPAQRLSDARNLDLGLGAAVQRLHFFHLARRVLVGPADLVQLLRQLGQFLRQTRILGCQGVDQWMLGVDLFDGALGLGRRLVGAPDATATQALDQ